MSIDQEKYPVGERVCGNEHYGFVVETSSNGLASEVWCVACKELIRLPENTVNAELNRLDWVHVGKEEPTVLRSAKPWFSLRYKDNLVQASVALTIFDDGSSINRVGYSMPLGRVGIFFRHNFKPGNYYMVAAALLLKRSHDTNIEQVQNQFNVKWIVAKTEEPTQMRLIDYIDWDKEAASRQIFERAVIVKKRPNKLIGWKESYGMVTISTSNLHVGRQHAPNVGDFVMGIFTRDFEGNWHLCSPKMSEPSGIERFDLVVENHRPDKPVILLRIDKNLLRIVGDSDPPVYEVSRFAKLYDENQILKESEGQSIHSVIIKWLEDHQIWQVTNVVFETSSITEELSIILKMPALCESVERNPIDPMAPIEKVKFAPSRHKPYYFYISANSFNEIPVPGELYMVSVGVRLVRPAARLPTAQSDQPRNPAITIPSHRIQSSPVLRRSHRFQTFGKLRPASGSYGSSCA